MVVARREIVEVVEVEPPSHLSPWAEPVEEEMVVEVVTVEAWAGPAQVCHSHPQ